MTPAQIVANIQNAFEAVKRHSVLAIVIFSVLMGAAVVVVNLMPRTYQAAANVLIVNGNSRNDPTLSSPDLPSIVGSTALLERVQRKLGITTPLLTMKKNLVAKSPAYRSGIMRIAYSDSDRDRAATIVNGIADELASYYTELSTARYDDDLRALDVEMTAQKKRLESIDAQLRAQGSGDLSSVADPDADASSSQISGVKSQRAQANADLQADIANAQAAAVASRQEILANDAQYQQLQANLTKATADLANARARYTPEYPALGALQSRVSSLRADAAKEAARALASAGSASPDSAKAQAAVAADRAKVGALDDELSAENGGQNVTAPVELLRLERQEVIREYQSVAARRATSLADRADALSLGSVEVVDRAIPSEAQTGMGRLSMLLIAAFLISILAIGCAFLADQLDPTIRRASQIEALYGKPLLATLRASHRESQ